MSDSVKLLLVEDSETDAELLLLELRHYGYDTHHDRVDSEAALRTVLTQDRSWDLVLCDHGLPSFSSSEALEVVRELAPEIPFVILSGTIGEEAAVEALKSGARDVVLKANLARLGPVVDRELRETASRRHHEQVERDRAQLEAQLIHSQKLDAIGRLAAGIAHDYRNLLGVVLGFSDLALRQMDEDHKAFGYITEIRTAGQRAISLTEQLLTFSRSEEGTPSLVDVNAMLEELEPMVQHLVGTDVQVALALSPGIAPVLIEQGRLEQVIVNLAANARDAMPGGGTLTLESCVRDAPPGQPARHEGQHVVITARDTGVGMDEKTRDQIFEPFFTTKDAQHGTGLGLATSCGIVEHASGFMTVESELGHGAAFNIHLPPADTEADLDTGPRGQHERPLTGTETVLLIEENDILRRLLEEGLVSSGYVVLGAHDGNEALEISERHEGAIDMLVMDLRMPGMGGPMLVHRIRMAHPQVKVLAMSSSSTSQELADTERVDGFLVKPFTLAALAARLREILDS